MRHYCTKLHEQINLQCTQTVILILQHVLSHQIHIPAKGCLLTHYMHYKHKVTVYSPETGKSTERSSIQYQATTGLDKEVKVIIVLWIWRKSWQESRHQGYSALIHIPLKHTYQLFSVNRFFTCSLGCLNWWEEENNMSLSEFQITCHTKKQTQLRIFLRTCKKDFCHFGIFKVSEFHQGQRMIIKPINSF